MPDTPRLSNQQARERLAEARARRDSEATAARRQIDGELWATVVAIQAASDLTQKEVAEALDFSRETVRSHTNAARAARRGEADKA